MPLRPPIAVKATRNTEARTFISIGQASRFLSQLDDQEGPPNRYDRKIKRAIETASEVNGWHFSYANQDDLNALAATQDERRTQIETVLGPIPSDVSLRITDETPRRISVYDLISWVTNNQNPRDVFRHIVERYAFVDFTDAYMFPGQAHATPVTNARGVVTLINLLPGVTAAHFRMQTAHILVRYLGGDETLIAEIQHNAAVQHTLPTEHPMRMFGEAVEQQQASYKYQFISSSMEGKYLTDFKEKKVVYLVRFFLENQPCTKFGKSEACKDRMDTHFKTYPNAELFCMHEANHLLRIENAFKGKMESRGKLITKIINGKTYKEILMDIDPQDAESILIETIDDVDLGDYTKIRLEEIKLREKEIEKEKELVLNNQNLVRHVIDKLPPQAFESNIETLLTLVQKALH